MKTFVHALMAICCLGCATVSGVFGQSGSVRVTYYAPTWGPDTNGEEVVYFLKQVVFESPSEEGTRIYLCAIKPDGGNRKEIAWLWKDAPDQFFDNYSTAVTMDINAATKRAAIGVAYGGRGGIFTLGLDGRSLQRVWPKEWETNRPSGAYYPTWSPDGQWIAFEECHTENGFDFRQISKFRPDGTGYTNLTQREGWQINIQPAWSPAGDLIAYVSDRIANPARNVHAVHLWLMKPDGSEPRDTKAWGYYPRWSPDGKFILHMGDVVVEAASGRRIKVWKKAPWIFPKWGINGYVTVGPLDISIADPEGKASHQLLKNVSRKGNSSDIEKETFRW